MPHVAEECVKKEFSRFEICIFLPSGGEARKKRLWNVNENAAKADGKSKQMISFTTNLMKNGSALKLCVVTFRESVTAKIT